MLKGNIEKLESEKKKLLKQIEKQKEESLMVEKDKKELKQKEAELARKSKILENEKQKMLKFVLITIAELTKIKKIKIVKFHTLLNDDVKLFNGNIDQKTNTFESADTITTNEFDS